MNYNNLINDKGIYLYKENNFHTIYIILNFITEKTNKQEAIQYLLCQYLTLTNKKYQTDIEINKRKTELYSMNVKFISDFIEEEKIFSLHVDMISPNIINDDYTKHAFEFLKELLYNPDFTNQEVLEMIKRIYIANTINNLSNPQIYASKLYKEHILDSKKLKDSTNIEYIKNLINSITLKDLEVSYNKIMNQNSFYRGLIFGNITDKQFKTFRKYIPLQTKLKDINFHKKTNIKKENLDISNNKLNESIIHVTYSIDIPNKETAIILNNILTGGAQLSKKILREKYGLIYSSHIDINYNKNILCFIAMINKDNKEKFINALNEILEILNDYNILTKLIDQAKNSILNNHYNISEKKNTIINNLEDYICNIYNKFDLNDFVKNIESYDKDNLIKSIKSIKMKNVFMYKGEK